MPINKLTHTKISENEKKYDEISIKPSLLYESSVIKLLQEDEIVEKDIDLPQDFPLHSNEINNEELFDNALNKNFVKVSKQAASLKKEPLKKKNNFKNTENFVKATMSRSKSSKKLGKTGCPKKKFRYFTPVAQGQELSDKILYSAGYQNKKRTAEENIELILNKEFNFSS